MLDGIASEGYVKEAERIGHDIENGPIDRDGGIEVADDKFGNTDFATNIEVSQANDISIEVDLDRDDRVRYISLDPSEFSDIPPVKHQRNQQVADEVVLEEEFTKLNVACRIGDINLVQSLLATPGLDINQVDEWDYSPLILLAICGHKKIVEMLLSRGAVCERDTFQGARCIYGALNNEIRDLLISFDMTKAVDESQPFAAHLSSILNPNQIPTKDIIFHFPHAVNKSVQTFRLNRFLLSARSSYFSEKLNGDWKENMVIVFPNTIDAGVFKIIINYIYLRTDFLPIDDKQIQPHLEWLARQLNLDDLSESIQKIKEVEHNFTSSIAKVKHEFVSKFILNARNQLKEFLKHQVLANKHVSLLELQEEVDFEDINIEISQETREGMNVGSVDLILSCLDAKSEAAVYYPVHKSVAIRSEYFDTMLKSDMFQSTQQELPLYNGKLGNSMVIRSALSPQHFPVIRIGTSVSSALVAEIVLSFLYHDMVDIPLLQSIEVIFAADELFLDRLKSMSVMKFTSGFNFSKEDFISLVDIVGYDAYDLIRISWQTRSEKLEHHVTKMIAYNISKIFHNQDEHLNILALIKESADRINERQDTDTIELVDDIRFNLGKKYDMGNNHDDYEVPEGIHNRGEEHEGEAENGRYSKKHTPKYRFYHDISLIDELLAELQLNA